MYAFAAVDLVDGKLTTNLVDMPIKRKRKTADSKNRLMQLAFAGFLRHLGKHYPANLHPRVVLVIDNAPWHRGKLIDEALAANPHLEFYRLPSYSPQLNVIERFWKILRRRATHNRVFDTMKEMRGTLRNNFRYYQAYRRRILSLIRSARKRAREAAA